MKLHVAPVHLSNRLHRPLRFGRMWRGHELLLRIIQLVLLVWFAVEGARWIAQGARMVVERLT